MGSKDDRREDRANRLKAAGQKAKAAKTPADKAAARKELRDTKRQIDEEE